MREPEQRCIAVLRRQLLPPSETFVRQQLLDTPDHRSLLVGLFDAQPSLELAGVAHRVVARLPGLPPATARRIVERLGLGAPVLRRALQRLRPDLVHVHFGVDAVQLADAWRALDVPVVVTLHGYDVTVQTAWWDSGAGGARMVGYHRRLAAIARQARVSFIAVSQHIRQRALALGIPDERIVVRHIGVDTALFRPAPWPGRPPRLLFVGRLIEKKGCELLIRAVARLKRRLPALRLVVVGDGPLAPSYRQLAAALAAPVEFRGALDPAGVRAELAQARLFCLPSVVAPNGDAEGLPIVLLEAQACGVPVLTSAAGGVDEGLIDAVTGRAFAPGDVDMLTMLIGALIDDDERLASMSRAARRFVETRFDLRQCNAALGRLYDERIAREAPAPS